MKLMGIGDEAGASMDSQIAATRELGWQFIEMRAVELPGEVKANFHDIPDAAFDAAVRKLEEARIQVYCFGSAIMNWAKQVGDPFEATLAEVKRAIPRMKRTGAKYVRIMSFKPGDEDYRIPTEVFRRVRDVTNRFLDEGLQPVHENCMNHGGMSWQHALELQDKCPGLQWVFDTGNPVFNPDRSRPRPWPRQDAWEFWEHVRDHVTHLHIKDATWDATAKKERYEWPGEGAGHVEAILRDALAHGYTGGVSIEPHMVTVFHEPGAKPDESRARNNFVEYGRRVAELVEGLRKESKPRPENLF